jgi:diguanylate cyclase (GGDEF)-like protein
LTEVSERKAVEQHLRASEARFRDLSEMTSDWFWEQDLNFRFKDMSHGLLETDFDPKSTLGKTRRELPILGLTEGEWQKHEEALHAHQPFKNFVYQFESGPSDLRWFSISGKPVFENGVFTGYRGSGSDITSSKVAEQQIAFLAYHDSLTGLPNRLLLQHRVSKAIAHADRSRTQLALLFLDLDNFKQINDSLGHAAGDLLLKEIASRLGECVRDTDTISRQGGDEFVIVLSNLPEHDGTTPVLTKILERLQDPFVVDGNELSTSVSIGIAAYPKDGEDFETLSKKSDMAMYRAKEAGRNTFRFFDETMNGEAVQHLVIRNGLRRALERSEFSLYYQPQIDLISGAVVGAEALTHWHHPELGMVSPANFIPIAEESGLIIPLGEWVLREACSQAVNWQKAGLPKFLLAVNLSAVQFRRGNVEQLVFDALDQSGLDPELLELELTETTLIQNVDQVLTTIKALKRLGVKLAIDDFGTGYSSLSYLKRFNVDKLKIDQSFVRDLATDPDDAAIVKAIIQMAHSLNLQALAEGVENLEILERLGPIRCDQAQGYHFARPMPADQFATYLAQQAVT